jgi:hypothetical protein
VVVRSDWSAVSERKRRGKKSERREVREGIVREEARERVRGKRVKGKEREREAEGENERKRARWGFQIARARAAAGQLLGAFGLLQLPFGQDDQEKREREKKVERGPAEKVDNKGGPVSPVSRRGASQARYAAELLAASTTYRRRMRIGGGGTVQAGRNLVAQRKEKDTPRPQMG